VFLGLVSVGFVSCGKGLGVFCEACVGGGLGVVVSLMLHFGRWISCLRQSVVVWVWDLQVVRGLKFEKFCGVEGRWLSDGCFFLCQ
jgi:hypothetical protein